MRPVFEAVLVARLAPPFNPYKCVHRERFKAVFGGGPYRIEKAREFVASLTSEDISKCWYHQADWAAIADESIRILQTAGTMQPVGRYAAAARESGLTGDDRRWLISLFDDPIVADEAGYTNGQHRGCALRFSGASRAAVVTRYDDADSQPPRRTARR